MPSSGYPCQSISTSLWMVTKPCSCWVIRAFAQTLIVLDLWFLREFRSKELALALGAREFISALAELEIPGNCLKNHRTVGVESGFGRSFRSPRASGTPNSRARFVIPTLFVAGLPRVANRLSVPSLKNRCTMLERVERWRRPGFGCGIGAASFHFRPGGGERGQSCLRQGYHVLWHCGISLSGCPLFRAGPFESVLSRIHHFRSVRTTVSLVLQLRLSMKPPNVQACGWNGSKPARVRTKRSRKNWSIFGL
jgi:hypothetical protein